jgi:hypothetical protein
MSERFTMIVAKGAKGQGDVLKEGVSVGVCIFTDRLGTKRKRLLERGKTVEKPRRRVEGS